MSQTGLESASRELVPYTPPAPKSFGDRLADLISAPLAKTAIVGVAIAAGWAAGAGSFQGDRDKLAGVTDQRVAQLSAELLELRIRLDGQFQVDRQTFVNMQSGIEELQRTTASSLIRFNGVVDRAEADRAADAARIGERLARLEKQMSDPTPVGSIPKSQLPAPTAAPVIPGHSSATETTRIPMASPVAPKPAETPIKGYVLRGVADGVALVQTRTGLREIAPGDRLVGAGRVQAIEKRGRKWVVVTTEGLIDGDVYN